MKSAATPKNESQRLVKLCSYGVLDTPEEKQFDEITELASIICDTPIALVSLVDKDRQWFKSHRGLSATETSRSLAFCAHVVYEEKPLVVENTLEDERFCDNPLVTSAPNIRFYAGMPLSTPDGYILGTLCVIDTVPRTLTEKQYSSLEILSHKVVSELELSKNLEELKKANEIKSSMLSNASHELRTPLNAIVGFCELLNQDESTEFSEKATSYIGDIKFSADQLLSVINSILDLEKISSGKMAVNLAPVNIVKVFKCITQIFQPALKDKNITLNINEGEIDNKIIEVDEAKISQITINLISNAIKFSKANSEVSLMYQCVNGVLTITVSDQGRGISKSDQAHLFKRFNQVKTEDGISGSGLGLSICKELTELMKGEISLESELGAGTSVSVSIPIASASDHLTLIEDEKTLEFNNALVVEDNPLNQKLISEILKKIGLNFSVFADAESAFNAIECNDFDLMLFDINLPGMSGIDALKKLRFKGNNTLCLAITADVMNVDHLNTLFDGVITKPYRLSDIVGALSQVQSKNEITQ